MKISIDVEKLLSTIQLPGFIRDDGQGYAKEKSVDTYPDRSWKLPYFVRFTSPTIVLVIDYSEKISTSEWSIASGHTYFLINGSWLCFDRTGIDDSFSLYGENAKTSESITKVLEGEIERVAKYLAQVKAEGPKEVVPGTQWSVSAAKKAEIAEKLKKKGSYHFMPYGMGQGLMIFGKKYRYCDSRPAIAAFFGVPAVYTQSTDCD